MNVLSNYTINNRYQPQNLYRFPSAGFNNVVAFKAAPQTFKEMFQNKFFDLLVKEGATCALTNSKLLPRLDLENLYKIKTISNELTIPINLSFDYLERYNENFFKGKNKIYNLIKKAHKKHRKYSLKEIIDELYDESVNSFCKKEADILNNLMTDFLGKDFIQYKNVQYFHNLLKLREFIINTYYKLPESQRNTLVSPWPIEQVKTLNTIKKKTINKICRKISRLSALYNSSPQRFVINCKTKNLDSNDILLELLNTIQATLSPIDSKQKTQKKEVKPFVVHILSSSAIDEFIRNRDFNDILKYCPFPVRKNLQKHIDGLIEIQKKFAERNKPKYANKLTDYILVLKYELERHATRLKINVDELRNTIGQEEFDKKTERVKNWLDIEK